MMDDFAEAQEVSNEIANAIANPVGFEQPYDEDEIEAEFEEMFRDLEVGSRQGIHMPELPDVPRAKPRTRKTSDEELEELKQMVAS